MVFLLYLSIPIEINPMETNEALGNDKGKRKRGRKKHMKRVAEPPVLLMVASYNFFCAFF
jgi:hypothetical protein